MRALAPRRSRLSCGAPGRHGDPFRSRCTAAAPAGRASKAEGAATGEQIEHSGVLEGLPLKPVEQRFPAPPWGRTEAWARPGYAEPAAPERPPMMRTSPLPLGLPRPRPTLVSFSALFNAPSLGAVRGKPFASAPEYPMFRFLRKKRGKQKAAVSRRRRRASLTRRLSWNFCLTSKQSGGRARRGEPAAPSEDSSPPKEPQGRG